MDVYRSEAAAPSHREWTVAEATEMAMRMLEAEGVAGGTERGHIAYSQEDMESHIRHAAEALRSDSPRLFSDYLQWNKVFFESIGMGHIVEPTFRVIAEVMTELGMGDRVDAVMRPVLASFESVSGREEALDKDAPLHGTAALYTERLLKGDKEAALRTVKDAMADGATVADIYKHVFQPSLRRVGHLWQTGEISVAKEHFFTSATQTVMASLYPEIFATPPHKDKVVAVCVSGELHEMGIRMISDLLEMDGYDTTYLGANTPADAVVDAVKELGAKVLLVSTTMTYHLDRLRTLIGLLRADDRSKKTKVFVGGRPFIIDSGLWASVGADGMSKDMDEAVMLVKQTLGDG